MLENEGVKFDGGKVRLDLVDPGFILGIADVLTYGAKKYDARNWEKGMEYGRVYRAALNHLLLWWMGRELDSESGLHHLHHAACCLMFLDYYVNQGRYEAYDDRPIHQRNREIKTQGTKGKDKGTAAGFSGEDRKATSPTVS